MIENYPIEIKFDISKLDAISRRVIEKIWLKELELKLALL